MPLDLRALARLARAEADELRTPTPEGWSLPEEPTAADRERASFLDAHAHRLDDAADVEEADWWAAACEQAIEVRS